MSTNYDSNLVLLTLSGGILDYIKFQTCTHFFGRGTQNRFRLSSDVSGYIQKLLQYGILCCKPFVTVKSTKKFLTTLTTIKLLRSSHVYRFHTRCET